MSFQKSPAISISRKTCSTGWEQITQRIKSGLGESGSAQVIVIECYQGTFSEEIKQAFIDTFQPSISICSSDFFHSEEKIESLMQPDVTDDRIFGKLTTLEIKDLIDPDRLRICRNSIAALESGTVLIYGPGASLIPRKRDVLIYADMARWEIQLRMRNNEVPNLGRQNAEAPFETKYKIGYFVDWRICDKLKQEIYDEIDWILDTNDRNIPKLIDKETFDAALAESVSRPFSLVPFFDPGPWGGQWMREVCDLDKDPDNFAWCFNCVPEENSVYFKFDDGSLFESPSINIVFFQSEKLLGTNVYKQFGAEFPIRFDFLDTIGGGNLSLQVHPTKEYIEKEFGLFYTQDESYYLMDAEPEASVYLGLKDGINSSEMLAELESAQKGGSSFNADKFVKSWPAKKHDHFLIPDGTVHCSGKGCMVLEISATPYIFTFKLWDWDRLGLDGKPRPINIDRGSKVIDWSRTPEWTGRNLVNQFQKVAEGDGWVEEKTGLHKLQFIETRRHWFSKPVKHTANGSVTVFNLVEGEQALVSSPSNQFEDFIVNYAETFILPAAIREYTISPYGKSEGKKIATVKAFVRT